VKRGDWTFLGVVIALAVLFFLLLRILRLEIGPAVFKYRNLSGSREVAFADIGRAYFEVLHARNAPQGVAAFWVERRGSSRVKVNLRTFPIEATAVLFTALESHSLQIEIPDLWAARRMAVSTRPNCPTAIRASAAWPCEKLPCACFLLAHRPTCCLPSKRPESAAHTAFASE